MKRGQSNYMYHVLTMLEQKTALQTLTLLYEEHEPIPLTRVMESVTGGQVAVYDALDKLISAELIEDKQKYTYCQRKISLQQKGEEIAYKIIEIENILDK
ncbi:MAG: hypothetical protein ACTSP3_14950 [Candidatus Heimdallarchaeaceae archaeon]